MSNSGRSYFGIVLTIVGLVAITAGVIIFISFAGSRKAITDMALQLQAQVTQNVQNKLSSFVELPHALNEINSICILQNPESLNDLEIFGERMLRQLKAFESIQNMAVGLEEQGNFIGSGRTADGVFTLAIRDKMNDSTYRVFELDAHGQKVGLMHELPDYDARERPWYKTAVQAGEATWSPIYIWASGRSMGLTAVLPIFDDQVSLVGVHQTASSLEFVSEYLQGVAQGRASQVFLLEPDGLLVATSAREDVVQSSEGGLERIHGTVSSDQLTRQASIYLEGYLGYESGFEQPINFTLNIQGQRYYVSAAPLTEMRGLDWILVTSISEAEIMSDINNAQRATLGIVLAATLASIIAGALIARKLASSNQQLQTANADKDRLFTIIAHDLKSPLAGISGSTEMLSKEIDVFSKNEIQTLCKQLHVNSSNTLDLLNDLLQWARMSQEGVDYSPKSLNLNELVNTMLAAPMDVAGKKDISIGVDIPQDLRVMIDVPMIKTVLRNLLFNAIKFTPRRGRIMIIAGQDGRHAVISVKDNGIGMDQEIMSSVFSVEKKKWQIGTEGEKGTGLGLILCKQFIEQHGGKIWVQSEPDQGTTVSFTLPLA